MKQRRKKPQSALLEFGLTGLEPRIRAGKERLWWALVLRRNYLGVTKLAIQCNLRLGIKRAIPKGKFVQGFVMCRGTGRPDATGCMGVIVLPRSCGNSLAAHEATHLALFRYRWTLDHHLFRTTLRALRMDDERIATFSGDYMLAVGAALRKMKVW